ncbi:YitT family protein [Paenibacillus caseinilyticus]|uniref:Membrane protein n=1 Tax=Paenibacillus mucilaginosus K02 TaxID=997761 RepID=I0BA41_9BACL|nr:YitT family protein [Paenibacillus mucilaginosus]AFH59238.1 membrane protein [Paenibacillus mucilaginosus K02]
MADRRKKTVRKAAPRKVGGRLSLEAARDKRGDGTSPAKVVHEAGVRERTDAHAPDARSGESPAASQGLGPRGGVRPAEGSRMNKRSRKGGGGRPGWMQHVREYLLLLLGSLVVAVSFNIFLGPNQVASGGVTGISIIVEKLFGIEPAFTQWALNIPLFLLGTLLLGRQFGAKTLVGSIVLPLFVLLTKDLPSMTDNVLLASIYGGIGIGVGLGLVFRGRASTGGMDLAAQMLHRYTGISLGLCVALLDGLIILTAGVFLSPEKAMYALIGLFVTTKTINIVQLGLSYSKVAFIISEAEEEIREGILYELDRGLTKLQATGGYTGESKRVLMVVVSQTEVSRLKELVRRIDPGAFVILSDTNEVLGEGFKLTGSSLSP